jgi:hypothetical protein
VLEPLFAGNLERESVVTRSRRPERRRHRKQNVDTDCSLLARAPPVQAAHCTILDSARRILLTDTSDQTSEHCNAVT